MARPGVTYLDVARAATAIKAKGDNPTIDKVREHLGTGSGKVIKPFGKGDRLFGATGRVVAGIEKQNNRAALERGKRDFGTVTLRQRKVRSGGRNIKHHLAFSEILWNM